MTKYTYIFLTILLVLLIGCSRNKNPKIGINDLQNNQVRDSIYRDSIKTAHDSILLIEGNKAIGNIMFGISKKEFTKQSVIFQDLLKDSNGKSRIGDFVFKIEPYNFTEYSDFNDFDYILDDIKNENYITYFPAFFKNELFCFQLLGEKYLVYCKDSDIFYNSNKEINTSINSLSAFLQDKYGLPSITYSTNTEWRYLQLKTRYDVSEWNIGDKSYKIYVLIMPGTADNAPFISKKVKPYYAQVSLSMTDHLLLRIMEKEAFNQKKTYLEKQNKQKVIDDKTNAEKLKTL